MEQKLTGVGFDSKPTFFPGALHASTYLVELCCLHYIHLSMRKIFNGDAQNCLFPYLKNQELKIIGSLSL